MKTAVIVLSDPNAGEEALGRVFNALAAAYDFKSRNDEVALVFQGAGTRWVSVLTEPSHPAHALYAAVEDKVAGVSRGCADVFGARSDAERNGFELLSENAVPGTSGLPSLARYAAEGYTVLTF
jgi:hypothetical protein